MAAIFFLAFMTIGGLVTGLFRRSAGNRHSMEHYRQAMGVLGDIRGHDPSEQLGAEAEREARGRAATAGAPTATGRGGAPTADDPLPPDEGMTILPPTASTQPETELVTRIAPDERAMPPAPAPEPPPTAPPARPPRRASAVSLPTQPLSRIVGPGGRGSAPTTPPLVFTDDSVAGGVEPPVTSADGRQARASGDSRRRPHGGQLALIGAIVVVGGGALAYALTRPGTPSATGSGGTTQPTAPAATSTSTPAASTTAPPSGASSTTTGPGSSTTTTGAGPSAGGPPVISSLSPASGSPGTTLTLTGSGFMSSDGTILATFNGHPATTRCPDAQQCTIIVPTGLKGSVAVQVKTAGGASNALTFNYD